MIRKRLSVPGRALREAFKLTLITAATVAVAFLAPRAFPLLELLETRIADIRFATAAAAEPQHPDIVVVTVTEETLVLKGKTEGLDTFEPVPEHVVGSSARVR